MLDTVVLPKWGDVPLKKIDYASYIQWIGSLNTAGERKKPLSASRIIQAHQLVGFVLKYAQRTGKVAKNVALELKRSEDLPQPNERECRYLSHTELLQLAAAIGRYQTLTLVLGYCGLRIGEAAALRRKHVGVRTLEVRASAPYVTGQGIVESDTTKTTRGRSRHVPVPAPVWDRGIWAELPKGNGDLLFPSVRGGILSVEEYRRAFVKACAQDGIEGLAPHGLRHTTASLAVSAGANVKVVHRMLGHASAAMTLDLYGHLFEDDLSAVADALGREIQTTAVSLRYGSQPAPEVGLPVMVF